MKQTAKPTSSEALDAGIPSQAIGKYATNFELERLRGRVAAAEYAIRELKEQPASPARNSAIGKFKQVAQENRRAGRRATAPPKRKELDLEGFRHHRSLRNR